jgi:hypothetical protein
VEVGTASIAAHGFWGTLALDAGCPDVTPEPPVANDEVQIHTWEGMPHVFPTNVGVLHAADKALEHIASFLRGKEPRPTLGKTTVVGRAWPWTNQRTTEPAIVPLRAAHCTDARWREFPYCFRMAETGTGGRERKKA